MTTKIERLKDKIARLEIERAEANGRLERAVSELKGATDTTPYPSGPQTCTGCGLKMKNELEFWSHFHIPNPQYLNLGDCPERSKR